MKAGTLLIIFSGVVDILESHGLILPDGSFGDFGDIETDTQLANDIEDLLIKHGLDVPEKVTKIVKLLPLIVQLADK